jgi:uncharacterized protein
LKELAISWFGGEPLLAFDELADVQRHAFELCRSSGSRVRFASHITTNASLLTLQRFGMLVRCGLTAYQITLDGSQRAHDLKRRRRNGSGTFDQIWANLVATKALPDSFEIMLRIHLDPTNYEDIGRLIVDLAAEFGGDPRYQLFVRPLARLGGSNDERMPIFAREEGVEASLELMRLAAANGLTERNLFASEGAVCYAAAANSFVVRPDGRVSKCTVALDDDRNVIGRLTRSGKLDIDPEKLSPWVAPVLAGDAKGMECPMTAIRASGGMREALTQLSAPS